MPSLVGYADDGAILVGEQALYVDDAQLVRSIKRCITENRAFVQLDTPTGTKDVRADDLMVEMLRETVRRASAKGVDMTANPPTLGCPAMWDGPQRRRLHELARRAGLDVTLANLVDEPVAAGIAWLSNQKGPKAPVRVLVFDMGGGTLDIAVLEVQGQGKQDVSVLAALGVAEAGNALDRVVAEDLEYRLAASGIDVRMLERPKRARQRLQHAAPDVKISLSSVAEVDVKLPRREFGVASIPYSREQLNEVFAAQMDRAEQYVETALRIAALPNATEVEDIVSVSIDELAAQVDVVVLSGGMSQIPYVTERLAQLFPPSTRIELAHASPEFAVATGLALASGYARINKYRPAFDIVLEWDKGRQQRTVYEAYTPLLEMRQLATGDGELRLIRTGRQLKLPEGGTGRLRVVSHSGEASQAKLDGSTLDGFAVELSYDDFEFSLYPDGRIHLIDGKGEYEGQLQ
nr:Hsp70 family protein [Allorhizocola rhizosphaerae]